MPVSKPQLSRREARAYQTELLQLQKIGIPVGRAGDFSQAPVSRLQGVRLSASDHECAKLYDMPGIDCAVVIPAKLLIPRSGILIESAEMCVPWDPMPLELEERERYRFFDKILRGMIPSPPTLLNSRLIGKENLYRGQWEGVIVGTGSSSVPARYAEGTNVSITLALWDEWGNESKFTFHAGVDRVHKQRYERERAASRTSHKRIPLFSPEANRLQVEGMEPAGIRWLRELEHSARATSESGKEKRSNREVAERETTPSQAQDLANCGLSSLQSFTKVAGSLEND
jgi:hypothetical protein